MLSTLKSLIQRYRATTVAWYVFDDARTGWRLSRGRLGTDSGSHDWPLEEMIRYIDQSVADYKRMGGFSEYAGTVAEIGPGDTLGIAASMRAHGAAHVHAIDRYVSYRDPDLSRRIYEELGRRPGWEHMFDGPPGEATLQGVTYHAGIPAERFFRESGIAFDLIVSCAVMEHLYDPIGALDDMAAALRPGGTMVHRIDLRDHGMFRGAHPLTFLTTPDWLHALMTRNSGRPNRVLADSYREWAARQPGEGRLIVSMVAGLDEPMEAESFGALPETARRSGLAAVSEIRPKLAARYRHTPDEDIAISSCALVYRAPGP